MIVPGYEFLSAHFCNNERTIVKAWWKSRDGMDIAFEYIEAKDGDRNWENLLTHIDIDTLHEATYQQIKAQNQAFKDDVKRIAKKSHLVTDLTDLSNVDTMKLIVQVLFGSYKDETDKEKLFNFKLKLLEIASIQSSNKKTLKAKLRRSKNMLDAIKAAVKIIDVKEVNV